VDRRARVLRFGALVAAASTLLLGAFSTSARAAKPDPTIVLVHGAFASPAGWSQVAHALRKDGYRTAAPALGLALRRTTWRSFGRRWTRSGATRSW
jgi:pimeloyl-ACP methyl ester carboxylesterase